MDMLDIFALSGVEWVFDKVEERFGRMAAWFVTISLIAALLGAAVAFVLAVR